MGRVVQVASKGNQPGEHGLPKHAQPAIRIETAGVVGDFNHYRQEVLHGDPDSAVLLVPSEVLAELRAEGWPVHPGDFGENITTEGVANGSFEPGTPVRVGEVELVIARACDPCDNLFSLPYVGRTKGPAFLKTTLGRRGWYARVVRGGTVRPGDPVGIGSPVR